jgi:hypothetical protein
MGIDARPQEETSFHYSQQQTTLFKVEYWTIMCIEREREKQREREREREREFGCQELYQFAFFKTNSVCGEFP